MGISTIRSFCGSQIFEAVGLSSYLIDKYFTCTASRVGASDWRRSLPRPWRAMRADFPKPGSPPEILESGGAYHLREGGEKHLWYAGGDLQAPAGGARLDDYRIFKEYSRAD